jgi:hypothetical protein
MFASLLAKGYEVRSWNHADLIMTGPLAACEKDVEAALAGVAIKMTDLIKGGGGLTSVVGNLRKAFEANGWKKKRILVSSVAYDVTTKSRKLPRPYKEVDKPIHEIDHTKTYGNELVGLEIEWNSKDSVFYRDLSNISFLHAEQLLSLAVIVTRGSSLQNALPKLVQQFATKYNVTSVADIKKRKLYEISAKASAKINARVSAGAAFQDVWPSQFVQSKFGSTTTHAGKLIPQIDRGAAGLLPVVLIGIPDSVVLV